jgi:transposase
VEGNEASRLDGLSLQGAKRRAGAVPPAFAAPQGLHRPPRADERETLNGILSVLVTGCRWMDMPREDGSSKTAWRRLQEWQQRGVWQRLLDTGYPAGRLEGRAVAADATTIEARKGGRR